MKKLLTILYILLFSSTFLLAQQAAECEENVDATIETEVISNTLQASNTLTVDRKVAAGETLRLIGGQVIELLPGFEADYGSTVEGENGECVDLSAPGTDCPDNCQEIGLENTENAQCYYEWQNEEIPAADKNSPLIEVCPEETTIYTLKIVYTNGSINEIEYEVEVEENTVTFQKDPYYLCEGENSVELELEDSYDTYEWSDKKDGDVMGTGSTYSAYETGNYYVTVTNECGTFEGNVLVQTADNPNIVVLTPDPSICVTDPEANANPTLKKNMDCSLGSVVLEVQGGSEYEWSDGNVGQTNTVIASGEYSVTVTNEEGCMAVETIVVEDCDPVNIEPRPATMCSGGSVLLTATGALFSSYRWEDENGNILSAASSNPTYVAKSSGSYTVIANGFGDTGEVCESRTSVEITVVDIDIDIPNPIVETIPTPPVTCIKKGRIDGDGTVVLANSDIEMKIANKSEYDDSFDVTWTNSAGQIEANEYDFLAVNPVAGKWTVTIEDKNTGCQVSEVVNITAVEILDPMVTPSLPILCEDQFVSVQLTENYDDTYSIEWMNSNNEIVDNMMINEEGVYTATISKESCSESVSFEVIESESDIIVYGIFHEDLPVINDDTKQLYSGFDFVLGEDISNALAYYSGQYITISLEVIPCIGDGDSDNTYIRGIGNDGYDFPAKQIQLNETGKYIYPPTPSTKILEINKVDWFDLSVSWEISYDSGNNWTSIEASKNRLYVTWKKGVAAKCINEGIYYFGCNEGKGIWVEAQNLVEGIWSPFTTRELRRNQFNRSSSEILTYYKAPAGDECTSSPTIYLESPYDGECGAFMNLFQCILGLQGISSDRVQPEAIRAESFLVKNWDFTETPSFPGSFYPYNNQIEGNYTEISIRGAENTYNWIGSPDVFDLDGIPGQGFSNPYSDFDSHFLLEVFGKLYDPSYGKSYDSLKDWEEESIIAFFVYLEDEINETHFLYFRKNMADETDIE